MPSLEVRAFSGGMTDNYISGPQDKVEVATNMTIRPDTKLQSRPGCVIYSGVSYQIPFTGLTPFRVDTMTRFLLQNFYQAKNKLYRESGGGFTEIQGPSSTSAFTTSTVAFDQVSAAEWNNHCLMTTDRRERPVVLTSESSTIKLRTIGLKKPDAALVTHSVTGSDSRLYAFVYAHTYTIDGGISFTQRGAPYFLTTPCTGSTTNTLSGLPVLTNGTGEHFDTATIKLEIYRTQDAGDVFYKVGEVTNGTTSFVDSTSDLTLVNDNLLLYTEQDDVDYDLPPKCKYVVQNNGCAYYLNIEDSAGEIHPNRLVQAAPDQIYAANEANIVDFDQPITGAGVAGQNVLVFTEDRTYRLEGFYDSTGRGGISKIEISRTVGCVSHKSVVQTLEGCFWAAKDGFYFSNGFTVLRISEEIPTTYGEITASAAIAKRIYGAYDPFSKSVLWAASESVESDDNDILFQAHTYYGIRPDTPFTTWNGGYWRSNFQPASLLFYDGFLLRGDAQGYLLKHEDGTLNDAKIDASIAPTEWNVLPVIYDMRSCAYDFGNVTQRKWVTKIITYADAIAKVSFTIFSNNDNTQVFKELSEVKSNSPILWGDSQAEWGDTSIRWNYLPIISGVRRFPKRSIRCSYKQIRITNSYTEIDSSESTSLVTTNGTTNRISFLSPGFAWDQNVVDYKISFETDGYTTEWLVASRISDTEIEVADGENTLPTLASIGFKMRGYRKNEALRLLSYSIVYEILTSTQTPFRAAK